jgi:uncharacterized Fe-S center protein
MYYKEEESYMLPSKVAFTDMRTRPGKNMLDKLSATIKAAGMDVIDFKDKLVAVKIHFGEPGNIAYVRPNYVAVVIKMIQDLGGKPFLTDSNTLYHGNRANAVDHLQSAMENGFNRIAVGCDVIIADGLTGGDCVEIPIDGVHCTTAKIGAAIAKADIVVSINHFKGHEMTGFGGALKNLGMGSGSQGGKLEMHSASQPVIKEENCVACGACIKNCAQRAITLNENKKAQIDYDLCVGCGQCVAVCKYNAARVVWDDATETVGEKISEYAYAVCKDKPHFHINFIMNVSPNCDCWNVHDQAIVPDIGIAASLDPVAVDRACVDLVNEAPFIPGSELEEKGYQPGEDKFTCIHNRTRWQTTLEHAEKMGLGTQEYQLKSV